MWPYSDSSSRVLGVPVTPKIHIKLDDFAKSDKVLEATLTRDIWAMVEWLSARTDSTNIDVVKALLFQALYGRIAYEQLVEHIREQRLAEVLKKQDQMNKAAISEKDESIEHMGNIRLSRDRGTTADIAKFGKSNVNRKLLIPLRMWNDLDRQSVKAGVDLSRYVRGLLFKVLQGEVNYNQWQNARDELESQVRPPSRK